MARMDSSPGGLSGAPARLSGSLPRLTVRGRYIRIASSGQPVLLRGVNRSGLEYSEPGEDGFLLAASLSPREFARIAREWSCDIVRIPFNQDWAMRGRGRFTGEDYLRALDSVIGWAARHDMYTLLDLQWLQADSPYGPNRQFIAPLPDAESAVLWRMLAERYRDEPAVLFDLYTEPHDCTAAAWSAQAQRLADAVWQGAPEAVVFVAGTNWAYDLRGVSVEGPAVVYSTHVYRNKGSDWEGAFGYRAAHEPVFAGEWGGGEGDRAWGARLLAAMDGWRMGWCAWSLNDEPFLQEAPAASAFGRLVREALAEG